MIYIVIPVFNRIHFTRLCLLSIKQQIFKDYKVIVVNDGSTDETENVIANEFPEVIVLKGDGALWWAGATNMGVNYVLNICSENDFVLTLNNDLEVDNNYLGALYTRVLNGKKIIVGSISVNINNTDEVSFCGIRWNKYTAKYHLKARDFKNSYKSIAKQGLDLESDFLPGRGTLIPVTVFKEIGLYDSTNFPHYAADEDFSYQAKKSGWVLKIAYDAVVKSDVSSTGVAMNKPVFSIAYFKEQFFSIKSPLNLKIKYRWALKNSPLKQIYFLFDIVRVSVFILKKFFVSSTQINL